MAIEIKWKDGETVKTSTISNDKILSTKMVSGKNQPFGAVEATFDRYIFSSEYKDDNWDSTSNPLPNITLGESKMSVDTFGSVTDYIITSVSNDEDYIVVTAHHPAYTLTHTYFNSLFLNIYTVYQTFDNYTRFSVNLPGWSDATFTSDAPNDWYRAQLNKGCSYEYSSTLSGSGHPGSYYDETPQKMYNISRYASGVGYYGGKEGYEEVAKKKHTVWYTYRDINLILHISVETVGGKNIRSIEWVEGETEDIVRFIIMMGVSDDVYPQTFSPPMTYYPDFDLDTGLIGADPKKEYTENELNKAMSKGLVNLNQESYASYDFGTSIGSGLSTSRIRLRVNGTSTCKSILDAIGSFTNRKYHFSSEGFFMTNNVPNSDAKQYFVKDGTFGHKKVTINTHKVVYLDMDTSSEYKGVEAEMTSTAPDIIDNTDAVVISSQTVYGENYSWKTSNISSSASKEGSKILFPIVDMSDDNTEGINSYRNRMLGLCAYNELVNRYRYENSIVYTTSEIDAVPKIEGGTPIGDYDEFLRETGQLYVSGDTSTYPTGNYSIGDTILFDDGIVMEKVKKDGAGIRDWVETDLYELSSSYKYSADSCTKLLKDNYNGFELNNVPLAFLIRSYPEHLTTLAWGKSHTNDLPEQLREQQEDIMINGSPGDEDAEISNKYSSRLVVGNLTQSQLAEQDDVKNGFTGLIMEKNVGAELYRLSGYDDGILQAEFDTRGRISAGGGSVILDKDGLNAGNGSVLLDEYGLRMEEDGISLSKDGLVFYDESHGTVTLNHKGMKLEDNSIPPNLQLKIDGTGIYDGENLLFINADGLTYDDVLVVSKDILHLKAHKRDGYDMSVDIKGEIDISDKQIDGGGVTLSNKGLVLEDIDGEAGSIILSNVDLDGSGRSKGLVALDPDGVTEQFSLTGRGLKLQDTFNKSMFMDSSGLSFKDTNPLDRDGLPTGKKSFIHMNASALTISQWMKIGNVEDYYEQVKLDGRGLSIHNDAIMIDRQGFRAKGVTINETGINIDRGGVVLNHDGLSFDQGVKLTSEGMSAGNGSVILDGNGLTTGNGAVSINQYGLNFDRGGVQLSSAGLNIGNGKVILNGDGLSAGYGGVNLDNEGLTINYDPANENFIQRNALRFRRSDIDFDTFRIYSRKYNQELDGGSSQPLQRGVANIITCETPEYRLVLSLPSTGTSGEIVEYNNNFYIWKGGWQLLGDIESLDNYIRIYTKPGYYSIINKSVTMRDTESSSDTNFKPGINTSSKSYNYNNGNLLSTNHAYVSYGSMSSSDTTFPPNNYNPAAGDGDKFVVTRYSFGTAGTPPRVDLPGQGDRSISFDIQVSKGNSNKDFTEVYVEYYPWEYVMGSDGIWNYKRADTPYRTRAQTFSQTGGTRNNVTFPLTHLYTTGYHNISIVVRGRWTDTEGLIYSPNFSMRKLRMNFTDEGEGGEVRLRNDCTKLYGNTSIVGTLDGTFSTTSLFKESLKRAITPLLTGVKSKPIMLSGKDGFLSRTPSYSMNVIGNTWYAPLSGGASSIVMFVMDNNVQDYDAYISRITNYGEMTTSTEIHVASHHGKSTMGGAGRSSGTILVPEGWGFKISRGTKVTIFGLTITDETV